MKNMIVGKKSRILKSDKPKIVCPNCQKTATITLKILGDYGHLFQIPFISKGKRGASECSNCQQVLPHQEMKQDLKLAYFELKEHTKIPIWFFSGLIAIKVLVIYKIIFINQ
ncbi:MAG: hypothetical protein Q7U08_06825 [Flavobacteriaceae bacterium]|nr:hypothetical protein [Flavobacteriaceae bacterium]